MSQAVLARTGSAAGRALSRCVFGRPRLSMFLAVRRLGDASTAQGERLGLTSGFHPCDEARPGQEGIVRRTLETAIKGRGRMKRRTVLESACSNGRRDDPEDGALIGVAVR